MKVKVLGCSGGIGGKHLRTTALRVDNDVLIDAGTGVADLSLTELSMIDHIFLTHSHLDHIATIPFIVDTVGAMRDKPLTIYGIEETLDTLKKHIFNWSVWPDFTSIPTADKPFMRYQKIRQGQRVSIDGRTFTPLPANHTVPAVGYQIDSDRNALVFTGDTYVNDPLWKIVNRIPNLKYLIIETAFCNRELQLAVASKHLCPSLLAEELAKLERTAEIFITHLKPGEIELTMQEIEEFAGDYKPRMLQNGQVFEF
jgi:cAMP phosphodiesterase